jgi:hypothetical protein
MRLHEIHSEIIRIKRNCNHEDRGRSPKMIERPVEFPESEKMLDLVRKYMKRIT